MPDLEIVPAKSGAPTLRWRGKALLSAYDPEKEAERLVGGVAEGASVVALLGLGLGYHAAAAARRGAYVVAVERRPEIAEAARRDGPWGAVEAAGRGAVLVGLEGPTLREAIRARLDVWTIRRVVTLTGPAPSEDAAYYDAARPLVRQAVEDAAEHVQTVGGFARVWLENALANLPRAAEAPTIAEWAGAWRGRPAVLLGAGPSAAEGIEILSRAPVRPPVVCVDAALPMALARGLVPDLVATADPQERVVGHLTAAGEVPDVPLVALLVGRPEAVARFARTAFVATHYPLEGLLGWPAAAVLDSGGGSVSTVAAAVLDRMGASPILLVGQDLGLPGGAMYAPGGLAEREEVDGAGRFATVETSRRRWTAARNLVPAPAADGGTVLSPPNLASYRRWFEAAAARGLALVQTSRRGARIEGADHRPLDEALGRLGAAGCPSGGRVAPPLPWRPRRPPAAWRRDLARWADEALRVGRALGDGTAPASLAASPVYPILEHLVVADAFHAARAEPERGGEILRAAARRAGEDLAARLRAAM